MKQKYKILLTGGGTGGSVAPLLAVAKELKKEETPLTPLFKGGNNPHNPLLSAQVGYQGGRFEFLWLGTKYGPEKMMLENEKMEFKAIASGKLRRYFSWQNFVAPFFILVGFIQSFFIILKWRPDLIISAGSFSSVPAVWAGWLQSVPSLVHQQDIKPGLANKLMAPFARIITVTFEKSLKDYGKKAIWTGNPVRQGLKIKNNLPAQAGNEKIKNEFNLNEGLPVVLVIGGGTGSVAINNLVWQSLGELTKFCQIIHVTGKNKGDRVSNLGTESHAEKYQFFEFLNAEQLETAYAVADVVVSRCGMNVLTELSYLSKPAILIPLPDSHQEENAAMFKDAAIVLKQNNLTSDLLVKEIKKLIADENLLAKLSLNISKIIKRGAGEKISKIIKDILFIA